MKDVNFSFVSRLRRSLPLGGVFALVVCTILACDDHDEFRKDVILCEEAVAYLDECCPQGVRHGVIKCHYRYDASGGSSSSSSASSARSSRDGDSGDWGGCNDRLVTPDLSAATSSCILATRCDRLAGICDAVAHGTSSPSCRSAS